MSSFSRTLSLFAFFGIIVTTLFLFFVSSGLTATERVGRYHKKLVRGGGAGQIERGGVRRGSKTGGGSGDGSANSVEQHGISPGSFINGVPAVRTSTSVSTSTPAPDSGQAAAQPGTHTRGSTPASTSSSSLHPPIVFFIVTGSPFHESRALYLKETWGTMACPECLVFVSDEATPSLPAYKVTEPQDDPSAGFTMKGWGDSIPKFEFGFDIAVAAAERAREAGSDVKWYYMAGDDTFVDVPKLSKFLEMRDHNDKLFIAECCTNGQGHTCEYNVDSNGDDVDFYSSCGGGGWIFSQGLLDDMVRLGKELGKTPGQLIHETHAPFGHYEHVIKGRTTQESDLGYAIKKLWGVDLTPSKLFNSGAPHEDRRCAEKRLQTRAICRGLLRGTSANES
ncbi:hypothetical protein TrLO_g12067 [Triparma laevis f. longispina]|uniref:N-acetylgalactosaminide beta-1,3-galactosyltransferase n=1 Tax=Triparma laevis f. longispina TaxID=1714387 RepID=A0A9W7APJ3_9STRA|nr:hypothetical protein TrLO_g12067 [Triparma laevis f. longispina]